MKTTNKKILIVEDDQPIFYSLNKKFELIQGVKVLGAADGQEGLSVALKEKPDLILLDIILPKMNGVEMLKKLRQDNWGKDIQVIVLSNLSNLDKEHEAKALGVKDYIVKADWKIEDVVKLVKEKLWPN